MKIIFALIVTLFIASKTPALAQINNSATEQRHDQIVTEGEKPAETVEVANQSTPVNIETAVVEPVQEQTPNQAEANVTLNPTNCESYRSLINQYGWDTRIAMAVMQAESGCNPNASNWNDRHATCTGSFGLFQLGCFWTSEPYDPATNVAKAYEIYTRSGWKPWGAFTNGSYQRYL